MLASTIIGSPVKILPTVAPFSSSPSFNNVAVKTQQLPTQGLLIECSSRPQKKATAHHMKTRPKKTQPWDVRRKPTVYPSLPPLPPDWTLVEAASSVEDNNPPAGTATVTVEQAPSPTGA